MEYNSLNSHKLYRFLSSTKGHIGEKGTVVITEADNDILAALPVVESPVLMNQGDFRENRREVNVIRYFKDSSGAIFGLLIDEDAHIIASCVERDSFKITPPASTASIRYTVSPHLTNDYPNWHSKYTSLIDEAAKNLREASGTKVTRNAI